MWVKLELTGELEEQFLKDTGRSLRTSPNQIKYYLQEIYNGNIIIVDDTTKRNMIGQNISMMFHNGTQNINPGVETLENNNVSNVNQFQDGTNGIVTVPSKYEDVLDDLDQDIYDF